MPVFDPSQLEDRHDQHDGEAKALPLYGGGPEAVDDRPWWLVDPPVSASRGRWPGGAKSPSWLRRLWMCSLNHALRYRYGRPDPSGPEAMVGKLVHGAFMGAALRRAHVSKRKPLPETASTEEMLHLLEYVYACCGALIPDGHQRDCMPTPLDPGHLETARETVKKIGPMQFRGVMEAETLVQLHLSPTIVIAGFIDLLSLISGSYEDPRVLEIVDYKSGAHGRVPDESELFYDPQCASYLVAVKRRFPNARVRFKLWNVAQDESVTVEWSRRLEEVFLANARMLINKWDARDERATVGDHCDYCPYRRDCPAYEAALNSRKVEQPKSSLEAREVPELLQLYREAHVLQGMADARKADLSVILKKKIPSGQKSYRAGHLIATRKLGTTRRLTTSPGAVLADVAAEAGVDPCKILDQVGNVSISKLKSWIAALPDEKRARAMTRFKTHVSKGFKKASLEIRENKERVVF